MDIQALFRNVIRSCRMAPRWKDRLSYICWLYASSSSRRSNHSWTVSLIWPGMRVPAHFHLRANRGSDRYVLAEVFEWNSYGVDLKSPARILDLGANAGFASVYFGLKWPGVEIVAVEPMPENVRSARRNFELNALQGRVVEAAIGAEDGTVCIRRGLQAALNRVEMEPGGEGDLLKVQARSVTSLLAELGWSTIDLVKMDIEGYEAVVLRRNNEWLHCVNALCLEVHGEYGEADLRELAEQFGFQLSRLPARTWLLKR